MSYVYSNRAFENVTASIEEVFQYYNNEIINNESKLIRVRYILFLGYLIDVMYIDNNEAFKSTIGFLYQSVDLEG